MNEENLIACLIKGRMAELGLREHELIMRLGYKNVGKGLRRLQQIYAGEFGGALHFLHNLAQALETDQATIDGAYQRTRELERERCRRDYELNFKPHAVYLTQHRVPTQIVVAGTIGADKMRYVYFEPSADPGDFKEIALERMPRTIPTFGEVIGFAINYSTKRSVEYDLHGSVMAVRGEALVLGHVQVTGI